MVLIYLLASFFGLGCAITWIGYGAIDFELSGRIALSGTMLITGLFHFKWIKGMMLMLPEWMPAKKMVVLATGILEILAAVGVVLPKTQKATGILLIIFLICILPGNIIAAQKHVNISKGDLSGPGISYLWLRVPVQLVLIGWVYWFCVR
jgi:uncharacterized membrane protein